MKFVGFEPLPSQQPVIELRRGSFVADLHNDGIFDGFDVHRAAHEVILRWRARTATWRMEQQRVIAGVALVFRDVEKCSAKGTFISKQGELQELDFIEYTPSRSHGSLRFVFDDDSEIEVVARSCELLLLQAGE